MQVSVVNQWTCHACEHRLKSLEGEVLAGWCRGGRDLRDRVAKENVHFIVSAAIVQQLLGVSSDKYGPCTLLFVVLDRS